MYWKALEGNGANSASEQKSDIKTGSLFATVLIQIT